MIVAAQRAYAERKTCMVRLEELKRELKTDAAQWEALMESCDAEMDALDEECAQREKELDDLERETAAMLAVSARCTPTATSPRSRAASANSAKVVGRPSAGA